MNEIGAKHAKRKMFAEIETCKMKWTTIKYVVAYFSQRNYIPKKAKKYYRFIRI